MSSLWGCVPWRACGSDSHHSLLLYDGFAYSPAILFRGIYILPWVSSSYAAVYYLGLDRGGCVKGVEYIPEMHGTFGYCDGLTLVPLYIHLGCCGPWGYCRWLRHGDWVPGRRPGLYL